MLLLNALAAGGEFDNFAVWEKSGTDFTIRVLDAATIDDACIAIDTLTRELAEGVRA
jgi:hypothetical protein